MKKYSNDFEKFITKLRKVIRNVGEKTGFSFENMTVSVEDNDREETQEIIEFPVNNLLFDYMEGKINDFYFAFPTQHEVMVHNIEKTDPEMIKKSISHLTSDRSEDFLSYHVFRFFRRTGEVEVIS